MAYGYRRPITIDATKVNATLTNFPVPIAVTVASLAVLASGGRCTLIGGTYPDIAFFGDQSLSTPLKCERVLYVPTTGQIVYFVKVPTIDNTTDTVIYVGYGDASLGADPEDPTNVWDSNFEAVFHFGDGTTLSLLDSTSNNYDLTNTNSATAVAGPLGAGAVNFNGTTQLLSRTAAAPIANYPFTLEAIVKPSASVGTTQAFCGTNLNASAALGANLQGAATNRARMGSTTLTTPNTANGVLNTTNWHYVGGSYIARADRSLIADNGAAITNAVDTTAWPSANNFAVGAIWSNGAASQYFAGAVAELRVSSVTRSDAWKQATYESLINNSTFYSIGAEEVISSGAPVAEITSPTTLSEHARLAVINFTGTGTDVIDGALTGASLVWTSNIDGVIGTGTSFSKTAGVDLTLGSHTIILTATDSELNEGTYEIDIEVGLPAAFIEVTGVSVDALPAPFYTDAGTCSFWVFRPSDIARVAAAAEYGWDPTKYATMISWPGSDEMGTDNDQQMDSPTFLPMMLGYGGTPDPSFPLMIVFAQQPSSWTGTDPALPSGGTYAARVHFAFNFAIQTWLEANYTVDTNRVFATGFSQGAFRELEFAYFYPTFFTALLSAAGCLSTGLTLYGVDVTPATAARAAEIACPVLLDYPLKMYNSEGDANVALVFYGPTLDEFVSLGNPLVDFFVDVSPTDHIGVWTEMHTDLVTPDSDLQVWLFNQTKASGGGGGAANGVRQIYRDSFEAEPLMRTRINHNPPR